MYEGAWGNGGGEGAGGQDVWDCVLGEEKHSICHLC